MPQMYENPIRFLRDLSSKVQDGWALIEFDYDKERIVLKREDDILKAVRKRGRIEWELVSGQEAEVIRGTDRFFII